MLLKTQKAPQGKADSSNRHAVVVGVSARAVKICDGDKCEGVGSK